MIYQGGNLMLSTIWEVMKGPVNDVYVCRDLNSPVELRYTLLVVHDRACIKKLLAILEQSEREWGEQQAVLASFAHNEDMCFAFEYRPERRLSAFAPGQMTGLKVREEICINLVMECLSSPLPYPLLYLVLTQGNVHLNQDNGVYFTHCLDLSQLDEKNDEAACVTCCAQMLLDLLEGGNKGRRKLNSYELLRKKTAKNAYSAFPELYRDIKVTALPDKKQGFRNRAKAFWLRNKDRIFHLLLVLCVIAVILAVVMLISQLIFGGIPLLRLFQRCFERIGTEDLTLR